MVIPGTESPLSATSAPTPVARCRPRPPGRHRIAPTVGDQRDAENLILGDGSLPGTDLRGDITRDHRPLGESGDHIIGQRAVLRHLASTRRAPGWCPPNGSCCRTPGRPAAARSDWRIARRRGRYTHRAGSPGTAAGPGWITCSINDAGLAVGLLGSSLLFDSQVPGTDSNCTSGQEAGWLLGLVGFGGVGFGTCSRPARTNHRTNATIATRTATSTNTKQPGRRRRPGPRPPYPERRCAFTCCSNSGSPRRCRSAPPAQPASSAGRSPDRYRPSRSRTS